MKGSKRERKRGVWELRVSLGRDPMTGRLQQVSRTFHGGKRAADDALRRLVTEVDAGRHGGGQMTVGDVLDRWLEHRRVIGRSPTTVANYESKIRTIKSTRLGAIHLGALSAGHLNAFYAERIRAGSSPRTVRHLHTILGGALRFAVRQGWTDRNITELAEPPTVLADNGFAPTPDQVRSLIQAAERSRQPEMATAIRIAALTGMRRGEVCGLRWSDVDFHHRQVTVARSVYQVGGEVGVKTPKNGRTRTVALDGAGMEVIAGRRARAMAEADEAGMDLDPDGYVLSDDPGGLSFYTPNRITQFIGRLRDRLGIPEFHFHALRRWSGTELVAAGVDIRDVAGRLGHVDGGVLLLRAYAQPRTERDVEAAAVLSRALRLPAV